MDEAEQFPQKPLDFKYLLIGVLNGEFHNIHMGAGRTRKELRKIAKLHKHWVEMIAYKKDTELTKDINN